MVNSENKTELEKEINKTAELLFSVEDTASVEYKNLSQKICTPVWKWSRMCFREDCVCNSGIEIILCIRRTLKKYDRNTGISYTGYLYTCLRNEIRHKNERAAVVCSMCSKADYAKAERLVKIAEQFGKNPYNGNVQDWLAKQNNMTLPEVQDLITKYYQSKPVQEHIYNSDEDEFVSIFETAAVKNNYPAPGDFLLKEENVSEVLQIIEKVFDSCQERQKSYLPPFITIKILNALGCSFTAVQLVRLLKSCNFLDISILETFLSNNPVPLQKDLADRMEKDEGYISNRIKDFFEKVRKEYKKVSIT